MPAIENVTRRGAVYWWRRRVRLSVGVNAPITICTTVSLLTKDQKVARHRAAAMTARNEAVRMSLYQRIENEGLSSEQAAALLQEEMIRYRNALAYQIADLQSDGEGNATERRTQMLSIYAALNTDFAVNGFADYLGIDYVGSFDKRFASLGEDDRNLLYSLLNRMENLPDNLKGEATDLLNRCGIAPSSDRIEIARRIMCEARAVAAATYEDPAIRNASNAAALLSALASRTVVPASPSAQPNPLGSPHTDIAGSAPLIAPETTKDSLLASSCLPMTVQQEQLAKLSPVDACEEYIRHKPKARGNEGGEADPKADHGRKNKSQAKTWGDSQRRQFKIAAFLFGKSNGGKPLAQTTQIDLVTFYDNLNNLPSYHHKTPKHEPMLLAEICDEALQRLDLEPDSTFSIGLDVGTINRHFGNLKRLCIWLAARTPVAVLDFSDFILEEEDRDDRDERDPYTIQQGEELFHLQIWTGGSGPDLADRLPPRSGKEIWHDAAYWVMPLVWYSGMRREEACKLLLDDIGEEEGIPYFNIRKTKAGSVKTETSVRRVPICSELRRLGFLQYVAAMRKAGEEYVFPEIRPGRDKRNLGDVFYKNVWTRIKPHLLLIKPGQAVHSGRHMVSTELKMLQTFEEFRADLLGQKAGGLNAIRYSGASRLQMLLDIVDRIPKVTKHLPDCSKVRLLPKADRIPRPVRESSGRRQRN